MRIETPRTQEGVPDVYYNLRGATGWLELKALRAWPARVETPLRVRHLTEAQVRWLRDEVQGGGRAHCLLRVGRTVLLLAHPLVAAIHRREVGRGAIEAGAVVSAEGDFPTLALVRALRA